MNFNSNRRSFMLKSCYSLVAAKVIGTPSLIDAQTATEFNIEGQPKHNIFSYRYQDWKDHFKTLINGAILADINCRCIHFWSADGITHKIYPTSVPLNEDLTKRGRTTVVQKVVGPVWRPTRAMRQRDPQLPEFMPSGPDNPLGSHALYLEWPSYRIHGTSDTRKIGRQSSSGCIGLYNEQIEELFNSVIIGTQVKLI